MSAPSATRVATRHLQASCLVGVSWAWIDPAGSVHLTQGKETHAAWVRAYFRTQRPEEWATLVAGYDDDATTIAQQQLKEEGWVRVASVMDIEVHSLAKVTRRAWEATAEMLLQCLVSEKSDPEKVRMTLEWSNGRRHLSAVQFLEEYGRPGSTDRLFGLLLDP